MPRILSVRLITAAFLIAAPSLAIAQVATIPGVSQSGTVPTGFQAQGFKLDCNNATPTSGQCWPLMEIWDGTNQATVNASDHGLTVHLGGGSIANTTFGATLNATPSLANGNGTVPTQGGAVLSATNGGFTNILIGNVAESATNGIFANQLQGNAALSVSNPAFTALSDSTTKVGVDATSTGLKVFIAGGASGVVNPNGAAVPASASPVTPSNQPAGSGAMATGQVSCGTSSTTLVAARTGVAGTGRVSVTVTNLGTNDVEIGNTGVTTSTGSLLVGVKGASVTFNTTAGLFCVAGSAQSVSYIENF